ncbi:MAG: hypothetical protein HYR85_04725 [Planctomycetes bacterium]|nr:hypothetical protein [Planctomycetota bacterium]MBI3844151.1 hypothetical protein [Planctomycetota bacterium]
MSESEEIKAVELVRRIRDEQAKKLAGLSEAEIIEFYRRAGEAARADARTWRAEHPPSEPRN